MSKSSKAIHAHAAVTNPHVKDHSIHGSCQSKLNSATLWPSDYPDVNRMAYDALAPEYQARRDSDRKKDLKLIQPFVLNLRNQFGKGPLDVLDLGCGNGLNLSMFAADGFNVTGIDNSARMLDVARESCPSAELIKAEFLDYPFQERVFHGVFAKAIIHLFPKEDALKLLSKIYLILRPRGILYVTTTIEAQAAEGLREKKDYCGDVWRYRRTWNELELSEAVQAAGFSITTTNYNEESGRGKKWFNIWASR